MTASWTSVTRADRMFEEIFDEGSQDGSQDGSQFYVGNVT